MKWGFATAIAGAVLALLSIKLLPSNQRDDGDRVVHESVQG